MCSLLCLYHSASGRAGCPGPSKDPANAGLVKELIRLRGFSLRTPPWFCIASYTRPSLTAACGRALHLQLDFTLPQSNGRIDVMWRPWCCSPSSAQRQSRTCLFSGNQLLTSQLSMARGGGCCFTDGDCMTRPRRPSGATQTACGYLFSQSNLFKWTKIHSWAPRSHLPHFSHTKATCNDQPPSWRGLRAFPPSQRVLLGSLAGESAETLLQVFCPLQAGKGQCTFRPLF